MIRVRTASGVKALASIRARTASGIKAIETVRVRDASGLKVVYSQGAGAGFSATGTPENVYGSRSTSPVVSALCTCVVTGGTGPFTYSWVRLTGPASMIANNPNSQMTTFQAIMPFGATEEGTFQCTVTDTSNSQQAVTIVSVTLERS